MTVLMSISALLLGAAAINLGLGLQASLLGLRAGLEDFSTLMTGLIMSSYYAGFVGGSIYAPRLVNRVGHIRTFSALASLASAAALCHAVFIDPYSWVIFRFLTGACFAGLCLVTESWLNERSNNLNRGRVLATYFITILGATAFGQVFLNIAPVDGYDLFVLVSVVISVALVPVALTTSATPVVIEPDWMRFRKLYKKSPVGVIGCLGSGLGTGAFWGLGAVFAQQMGLSTSNVAIFMALMILGGMATQWPFGRLSDKIDRRYVIAGCSLVMTAVGIVMGVGIITSETALYLVGIAAGGLLLPLYGIAIAHANDHMEVKDFVPASASLLLTYGCGAAAGPFIATIYMNYFGPGGLFIHAAVVTLILGIFALYRITQRAQPDQEDTVDFGLVPRTTAMAFEIDPRSEEDDKAAELQSPQP